jgi:DNA polymerase-3 subunit gamma/tau
VGRVRTLAAALSPAQLSRLWQMLLRALEEAGKAPDPMAAVEMAMVRLCAAQSLPPPEDAARLLRRDGASGPQAASPQEKQESRQDSGGPKLKSFEDVVALVAEERDVELEVALERHMRVTRFATGEIVYAPASDMPADLPRRLMRVLREATGAEWHVRADDSAPAKPVESLAERRKAEEQRALDELKRHPFVAEALKHFPGAEIAEVRQPRTEGAEIVPLHITTKD